MFTLPIEDEPVAGEMTWLTKGFELTDSLISWCKQNEMYVILDLHAAPGGQGYDAAISDYDDTKPSLWESKANRDKMVALWKRLAERYADEEWVAGYDLLNEPNWDLPGGVALRNLYEETTNSIRTVDPNHIIFIGGNWFNNDFTGLTPPWDDQLVYSPHKYWSTNDVATMQWVIDLRDEYNVPLYLGESGENSNVWFRDAIRLLEDLDIGWAWWPLKKIESIAGPVSVVKTDDYQTLLDYWSGSGSNVSAEFGKATLMDITEGLKIENCVFQKDVIDAMFRQVYSDETIPFTNHKIPGLIHASDFDMGVIGEAYNDVDFGNYSVSTGNYSPWNNGWVYRNDGVDIEPCSDEINANGFNVGFLEHGEWMQYDVDVKSGVYDILVRVASGGSGGRLHFSSGNADVTPTTFAPPTGDWQNWESIVISNVIMDSIDTKLRMYVDQPGFNISSFEFIETEIEQSSLPTQFVAAETINEFSIQMNANKFIEGLLPTSPGGFEIIVDGNSIPITEISVNTENPRIIELSVDYILNSTEVIRISYNGNQIKAKDGSSLEEFSLENVRNTLNFVNQIPCRIQAEAYDFQVGVSLETTTDIGGGENIAFLDPGDYLDYEVNVTVEGEYSLECRTAALFGTGGLELQLIDAAGNVSVVANPSFSSTGDWQNWVTTTETVELPKGRYTMRILITQAPFNLNWVEFSLPTAVSEKADNSYTNLEIFPNPCQDVFNIKAEFTQKQNVSLEIVNLTGEIIQAKKLTGVSDISQSIDLGGDPDGLYFVILRLEDGSSLSNKLVKISR